MANCGACAGSGTEQRGVETIYDSWGRMKVRILTRTCKTCSGSGHVPDPPKKKK
ncbi:MAG: hypothetical protein ACRDT8_00300 [Micromonosporaceae bacterium]